METAVKQLKVRYVYSAFIAAVTAIGIYALARDEWTAERWTLAAALYVYTGFGICLVFHRRLAHNALGMNPWVEKFFAIGGYMACQGTAATWTKTHKDHHAKTDKEGDPSTPTKFGGLLGFIWSHVGWIVMNEGLDISDQKISSRVRASRFYYWCDRNYVLIQAAQMLALYAIGGYEWFKWGFCVRVMLVWNATWLINSWAHLGGVARDSRFAAFFTFGEGYQRTHHAYAKRAYMGPHWYSYDPVGWFIRVLCLLRLAKVGQTQR